MTSDILEIDDDSIDSMETGYPHSLTLKAREKLNLVFTIYLTNVIPCKLSKNIKSGKYRHIIITFPLPDSGFSHLRQVINLIANFLPTSILLNMFLKTIQIPKKSLLFLIFDFQEFHMKQNLLLILHH